MSRVDLLFLAFFGFLTIFVALPIEFFGRYTVLSAFFDVFSEKIQLFKVVE